MNPNPRLLRAPCACEGFVERTSDRHDLSVSSADELADAVRAFRERLESDPAIHFVDAGDVLQRLAQLATLELPLRDGEGVLAIEYWSDSGVHERIQVASLFADSFELQSPTADTMASVRETVSKWAGRALTLWVGALYQSALDVLAACAANRSIDDAARATLFVRRGGNSFLSLRLAVEFAWMRALREESSLSAQERSVRNTLARRTPADYELLLGLQTVEGVSIPDEPWRTAFTPRSATAAEGYRLDRDAKALLAPFERLLCMRYAQEELGWESSDLLSYPHWLSEPPREGTPVV